MGSRRLLATCARRSSHAKLLRARVAANRREYSDVWTPRIHTYSLRKHVSASEVGCRRSGTFRRGGGGVKHVSNRRGCFFFPFLTLPGVWMMTAPGQQRASPPARSQPARRVQSSPVQSARLVVRNSLPPIRLCLGTRGTGTALMDGEEWHRIVHETPAKKKRRRKKKARKRDRLRQVAASACHMSSVRRLQRIESTYVPKKTGKTNRRDDAAEKRKESKGKERKKEKKGREKKAKQQRERESESESQRKVKEKNPQELPWRRLFLPSGPALRGDRVTEGGLFRGVEHPSMSTRKKSEVLPQVISG